MELKVCFAQKRPSSYLVHPKAWECWRSRIFGDQLDMLKLPVRYYVDGGIVRNISFNTNDQQHSRNFKKGFLNLLQVNRTILAEDEEGAFRTVEGTTEGMCPVLYTINRNEERRSGQESDLTVTKSIDLGQCASPIGQANVFDSSTDMTFLIERRGSHFLIKEADLVSAYSISPQPEITGSVFSSLVLAQIKLVNVIKDENAAVIENESSRMNESIIYSSEWETREMDFHATGNESLLNFSPFTTVKNKGEVLIRLVRSLVIKMETEEIGIEVAATHEMTLIVEILCLSTRREIRNFFILISEEHESIREKMKIIFEEVLAMSGTFNTIEIILERIRRNEISPVKSAGLLKQISSVRVPSENITSSVLALCKELQEPLSHQSCWLTVGSLLNRLCGEPRTKLTSDSNDECPRAMKERFVDELVYHFHAAGTRYEKILALKTMGNAGIDNTFSPLAKIINDTSAMASIRVEGIDALRKLRFILPTNITSILLPIYRNRFETDKIRISAFLQLLNTRPKKSVVEQIVNELESHHSMEIHAYLYAVLVAYSRSTKPEEKHTADSIKSALNSKLALPRDVLSRFESWSFFSDKLNIGTSILWASRYTSDSIIPKEFMTSISTTSSHSVQIGFTQTGIEHILWKILHDVDENGIQYFYRRQGWGKRFCHFVDSYLFQPVRKFFGYGGESEVDPHALFYLRVNDNDISTIPIDKNIVKNIVWKGREEVAEINPRIDHRPFDISMASMIYRRTNSIVTSLGDRLEFSSTMPTIVKVDGVLDANIFPDNLEELRFRLHLHPSLASTHLMQMEIKNPLVHHGAKIVHSAQCNGGINMTTEVIWKEEKFHAQMIFAVPEESSRFVLLSSHPGTFKRYFPNDVRAFSDFSERKISCCEEEIIDIDSDYLEKATGLKLRIKGHYGVWDVESKGLPSSFVFGDNFVEAIFEKTLETPEKIEFTFTAQSSDDESWMNRPTFEKFYNIFYNVSEEGLESGNFSRNYKTANITSNRYFASFRSHGGRRQHNSEVLFTTLCDTHRRLCKYSINALRPPVADNEIGEWSLSIDSEILYSPLSSTFIDLLKRKKREVYATVDSRWGDFHEENTIKAMIVGSQNEEQREFIMDLAEEDTFTPLDEYTRIMEASIINAYKCRIAYDIRASRVFDRLFSLLKGKVPLIIESTSDKEGEDRAALIEVALHPKRKKLNLTITTTKEKVELRNFHLPVAVPLVTIPHIFSHLHSFLNATRAPCPDAYFIQYIRKRMVDIAVMMQSSHALRKRFILIPMELRVKGLVAGIMDTNLGSEKVVRNEEQKRQLQEKRDAEQKRADEAKILRESTPKKEQPPQTPRQKSKDKKTVYAAGNAEHTAASEVAQEARRKKKLEREKRKLEKEKMKQGEKKEDAKPNADETENAVEKTGDEANGAQNSNFDDEAIVEESLPVANTVEEVVQSVSTGEKNGAHVIRVMKPSEDPQQKSNYFRVVVDPDGKIGQKHFHGKVPSTIVWMAGGLHDCLEKGNKYLLALSLFASGWTVFTEIYDDFTVDEWIAALQVIIQTLEDDLKGETCRIKRMKIRKALQTSRMLLEDSVDSKAHRFRKPIIVALLEAEEWALGLGAGGFGSWLVPVTWETIARFAKWTVSGPMIVEIPGPAGAVSGGLAGETISGGVSGAVIGEAEGAAAGTLIGETAVAGIFTDTGVVTIGALGSMGGGVCAAFAGVYFGPKLLHYIYKKVADVDEPTCSAQSAEQASAYLISDTEFATPVENSKPDEQKKSQEPEIYEVQEHTFGRIVVDPQRMDSKKEEPAESSTQGGQQTF